MNNIDKMFEVFDKTINEYSNPQALIYQRIVKKCVDAIHSHYRPGTTICTVDDSASVNSVQDYIYSVAEACISFVNRLP